MPWARRRFLAAAAASAALAGCSEQPPTVPPPGGTPVPRPDGVEYAYTHLRADGNRTLATGGDLTDADPIDVDVSGTPAWLLGFDGDPGSLWTVVRRDATAVSVRVSSGTVDRRTEHGPVASPPLGYLHEGDVRLLDEPREVGDHTHPVPAGDGSLYVASDGDVVVRGRAGTTRFDVDAPPDVRPVALDGDRFLVYAGATDRYRHAALGDGTEPSRLLVVDAAAPAIEREIAPEAPLVFEGLSPLAADLDGDGTPEIVTTVADASDGARIRVYRPDGAVVATGPVYGPGWRHQLCVAPFGPDGRPELAVVLKPHVTRRLEFYRLQDGALSVAATLDGFASHTYGSRTLDGGLAADLNGDGRPELLVPTTGRDTLAAVRRTTAGATTAFSLPLSGALRSNVGGVGLSSGGVAVAAGTDDAVRVWQG